MPTPVFPWKYNDIRTDSANFWEELRTFVCYDKDHAENEKLGGWGGDKDTDSNVIP
jgi:hypothetical protein